MMWIGGSVGSVVSPGNDVFALRKVDAGIAGAMGTASGDGDAAPDPGTSAMALSKSWR